MGDPRELEWAKKPDALKESWTARIGTHVYTEFPLHSCRLMDQLKPKPIYLIGQLNTLTTNPSFSIATNAMY